MTKNSMTEYDFLLKFDLPDANSDPEKFVDALYEAGCDDATIGIGLTGRVALDFTREANSAIDAVLSAIADVQKAIPGAKLIEATPDFVGLTDIADIVGCSRQNLRKIALTHRHMFPPPVHEGNAAMWHLAPVLTWFTGYENYDIDKRLVEISEANMLINIGQQMRDVKSVSLDALNRRIPIHAYPSPFMHPDHIPPPISRDDEDEHRSNINPLKEIGTAS